MSSKINRLRAERGKNDEKIAVLRARNNEIDKQITELENLDIVGMVRSMGMTLEQLAALIQASKTDASALTGKEEDSHGRVYERIWWCSKKRCSDYCNYSIDLVHLQSNGRRNCFGAVQNSIHEFLYKDECIRLISKVAGVKNRRRQMFGWSLTFTCCL